MKVTYSTGADFKVRDLEMAVQGRMKIDWAESRMPVMMALRQEHAAKQSLKGMRIAGCLHVTKETAVLIETLKAAGAEISWSGCNPLSHPGRRWPRPWPPPASRSTPGTA